MNKQLRSSLLLILTSFIWGAAFVAQSEGMAYVEPFTFCAVRFIIGGIVLLPVISFMKKKETGNGNLFSDFKFKPKNVDITNNIGSTTLNINNDNNSSNINIKNSGSTSNIGINNNTQYGIKGFILAHKTLFLGGLCCGLALFTASNLQQQGIKYVSSVGKAGFITALYIVLVPILGLFLKKKVRGVVWLALALAVTGLYFLCITDTISFEPADILLILCALVFAIQILTIDHFAPQVNCVAMSSIEFFVVGILSTICMFIFEKPTLASIKAGILPILYAGVFSSGVAYTLQVVAQKDLEPTLASMIMSLESVFSVLSGMVILHERLSSREIIGCVLMFTAVILSQLPQKSQDSC